MKTIGTVSSDSVCPYHGGYRGTFNSGMIAVDYDDYKSKNVGEQSPKFIINAYSAEYGEDSLDMENMNQCVQVKLSKSQLIKLHDLISEALEINDQ